ncbi:MAG TPA: cytochrome P450 [Pseudonocardiaceae bacterium]|nr:cytochrome P450 [Pseudonocardiaceae bacterium]
MTATELPAQQYPFGPNEGLALHPHYAELREHQPIARVAMPYGGEGWLATRYADVRTVLADPRFSRAATADREDVPRVNPLPQPAGGILGMDPPEHSRLRRLVARAFTVRRTEEWRPRVEQIVDDLVTGMLAGGQPADLAAQLAWPLPITVICEMLGVPYAERERFRGDTDTSLALGGVTPQEIQDARDRMRAYLAELVAAHRAEPRDDLLGELVAARDEGDGDRLSELELVQLGLAVLVAGHETTANQIGNFIYTLLSRRELWERLVADPGRIPAAVEELMRIIPLGASTSFPRMATEDLELDGQLIRAGETVGVHLAAGNRDGSVYVNPEEIDFDRPEIAHLGFGHGAHHCLGAPLARLELRTALATLVRRVPQLDLAIAAEEVHWRSDRLIRGVQELPVRW